MTLVVVLFVSTENPPVLSMSTTTPTPRNAFVDFKEVKARVKFVPLLERYDIMRTLKHTGDRLSGPCPIHRGTNPTQFRVSISKNCFNCFGTCGRGGNVIDFVAMYVGLPFRDAALLLQEQFMPDKANAKVAESAPPPNPRQLSFPEADPPNVGPGANDTSNDDEAGENPPLSFELKSLKADHPYLAERGLTEATIQSYGIGYCSRGCLRGYVAIPIRNRENKLVAYFGRWPGNPPEDKPEYRFPKDFRKEFELFNIHKAVEEHRSNPLLVVTSAFDCLHLVQLGYPRTVALLDTSLSKRQEVIIRDAVGTLGFVYLFPNANDAGRKGAAEAASRLCKSCLVRVIDIAEYRKRPGHLERHEIEALLSKV